MARKYINPNRSPVLVTDGLLSEARGKAAAAAERLRDAERADPTAPGWDAEYDAATVALRAAERRVEALERLRAAQVERSGKRDAAVKAAAADLVAIPADLARSRDAVAAAAVAHLRALAGLARAAEAHNAVLAAARARLATLGLAVRDELTADGEEHEVGTLERAGLRAGGIDWLPVPAAGLAAHACREVFGGHGPRHPLAQVGKHVWRSHEVTARADGLPVPTLASAGAKVPPRAPRPVMPDRPSIRDGMAPPVMAERGGYHPYRGDRRAV